MYLNVELCVIGYVFFDIIMDLYYDFIYFIMCYICIVEFVYDCGLYRV